MSGAGGRRSSSSSPHSTQRREPNASKKKKIRKKKPSPGAHSLLRIHFPCSGTTTPRKTHFHRWPCPKNVPERWPEGATETPETRNSTEAPRGSHSGAGGAGVTVGVLPSPGAAPDPPQPRRRRPCFIFRVGTEPAWERPRAGVPGGFRVDFGGSRQGCVIFWGGHGSFGIFWGALEVSPFAAFSGGDLPYPTPPEQRPGGGQNQERPRDPPGPAVAAPRCRPRTAGAGFVPAPDPTGPVLRLPPRAAPKPRRPQPPEIGDPSPKPRPPLARGAAAFAFALPRF